jgi:hypothetical protein
MRFLSPTIIVLAGVIGCGHVPSSPLMSLNSSNTQDRSVIKAGGIYSCKSGDGDFSVVKVLVVENGAVHARLHKNRFKERPTAIDPKQLEVVIGHVPLSEAGFRNWEPVLLMEQPVTDEELDGYRLWRDR